MTKTIIAIIIIATIWHFGIILITYLRNSSNSRLDFERLLRAAELELLEDLNEKLQGLPEEKLEREPYNVWFGQVRHWILKIREKYE